MFEGTGKNGGLGFYRGYTLFLLGSQREGGKNPVMFDTSCTVAKSCILLWRRGHATLIVTVQTLKFSKNSNTAQVRAHTACQERVLKIVTLKNFVVLVACPLLRWLY